MVKKNCKNFDCKTQSGVLVNKTRQRVGNKANCPATNVNIIPKVVQPCRKRANVVKKVNTAKTKVDSAFCGTKSNFVTPVNNKYAVLANIADNICHSQESDRHIASCSDAKQVTEKHLGKSVFTSDEITLKRELPQLTMAKKRILIQKARQLPSNRIFFAQNQGQYGFIPVSSLPCRIEDKSDNNKVDILTTHKILKKDGRPNYRGLQIPVQSSLNYQNFFEYLGNYWDWQLPFFIRFGFPLDLDPTCEIFSDQINHKSAILHPTHVDKYIKEEISHNAMLGPFKSPPLIYISLLS